MSAPSLSATALSPLAEPAMLGSGRRSWLKRVLPQTMFGRSLLIIVLPVLLMQLFTTFLFFDRHWSTMSRRLAYAMAGEIELAIEQFEASRSPTLDPALINRLAATLDLGLSFEPGAELGDPRREPWNSMVEAKLAAALHDSLKRPFQIGVYVPDRSLEIRIQLERGVLTVIAPQERLFSATAYLIILWLMVISLFLLALAVLFMRNQVRPIRRLAVAADSFGKGRDVPSFKPEGASEVRQAAAAFIVMRDRIRRQIAQRTDMLAGVSHDLRTPLTRMRLALAMMPPRPETAELNEDVAEMQAMVEGYLAFARGEDAEVAQPTDLVPLLREVAAQSTRAGGGPVALALPEALVATVRPGAIRRALGNLVGNARRYANAVWVSLETRPGGVLIVVEDDGPGVPEAAREEVFRPFMRLEGSRNRDTGGVGLGLTIARDIARSHGGDVVLGDSAHGGLKATIRLPV